MMSGSASEPEADPHRAAEGIRLIYDTARELTCSIDEIVWAVNPRHDMLESLATYLEKFAQDWLAGVGIRCRLGLPLQFPEWHLTSELRHNVFLAFKEALHNAVKHSRASEVLIRLEVKEKWFELTVKDNGQGFAFGEKMKNSPVIHGRTAAGNGLENMERRLAAIGGNCEIQSTPGTGTRGDVIRATQGFGTWETGVRNSGASGSRFCGINDFYDMTRGADWAIVTLCNPTLSGKVPCRA